MSMPPVLAAVAAAVLLALVPPTALRAQQSWTLTLGEQDFQDERLATFGAVIAAGAGEPRPFNGFLGTDLELPGSATFQESFSFVWQPVATLQAATLVFGINDHDSGAPGSQVAAFLLNGSVDLTALLDAAFEARPGRQGEVRVYELALPGAALAAMMGGSATFALRLQGPVLGGEYGATDVYASANNGAALDFARLELRAASTTVPEPLPSGLVAAGVVTLLGIAKRRHGGAPTRHVARPPVPTARV